MNGKLILLACLVLGLAACGPPTYPEYEVDQPLRRIIFKECMAALPAGPQSTQYNDWDEVVAKCDGVAYAQAQVCVANCRTSPAVRKE